MEPQVVLMSVCISFSVERALGLKKSDLCFLDRKHIQKLVLSLLTRLTDYCRATIGHETKEHFRLLFLNKKNELIADEIQQSGTVDHTPVYPREIVKRALELDAAELLAAFLVEIVLEADQFLADTDDATDHPVERTAHQILAPPRRVAGIDPVGRTRRLAALLAPCRLDLLHVSEIVDADRELDEMQRHRLRLVRWMNPLKVCLSTA